MSSVFISRLTAIISPNNINWLVSITDKQCVYCTVRAKSLYKTLVFKGSIRINFSEYLCRIIYWFTNSNYDFLSAKISHNLKSSGGAYSLLPILNPHPHFQATRPVAGYAI